MLEWASDRNLERVLSIFVFLIFERWIQEQLVLHLHDRVTTPLVIMEIFNGVTNAYAIGCHIIRRTNQIKH